MIKQERSGRQLYNYNKTQKNLGRYTYQYNAGLAYDIVARNLHGDFYNNRLFHEFEGEIPETDEGARAKAQAIIDNL